MSKSLERDVHVSVDSNIVMSIYNNGTSNFSGAGSEEVYVQKFLEGMKAEFSSSKVVADGVNPEFNVRITEFILTESTSTETVSDTTSEENGMTYELSKLEYSAKGTVTRLKDNVEYSWYANKDNEEKVKSNRTVVQLATGQNKEQNVYREKEFTSDEAIDLAWNIGRRSGNSIVKEILRALK